MSWLCLAALVAVGPSMAAESEVERQVADEVEAALLRLAESGALAETGRSLSIEREPRVRYELGAVVEIDTASGEAPIVAITPGGSAERMGLRVGDRILAINDLDLTRSEDPGADFARSTARAQGRLRLVVRRGERRLELAGSAERVLVPGFRLRIEQPDLNSTGVEPLR
nr:PDZ domain-containing protein [Lysobacter sp. CAU 1642]